MSDFLPLPDSEGLAKTKELYLNRFASTLDDEEAGLVLGSVMAFLYQVSLLRHELAFSPPDETALPSL